MTTFNFSVDKETGKTTLYKDGASLADWGLPVEITAIQKNIIRRMFDMVYQEGREDKAKEIRTVLNLK